MKNPKKDILRWNIRQRQTDTSVVKFPVKGFPLKIAQADAEKSVHGDRGKAIVRTDSSRIIVVTGSDYQIVPHPDVMAAVESMFDANSLQYEVYDVHTGGSQGNRMYVNYTLPKFKFDVEKDKYTPFVQLQNSYDKSLNFGLVTGLYRDACWNGNLWGTRDMEFVNLRHVGQNVDLTDIALNVDVWLQQLGIAQSRLKTLLHTRLTKKLADDLLAASFPKQSDIQKFTDLKILDEHTKQFGDNLYALFNAATAYATHVMVPADKPEGRRYDRARKVQMSISDAFQLVAQ